MTPAIHIDRFIDAKGQMCPMPVLTLARAIKELAPGQILALAATDQGARRDIPAWAERTGNALLDEREEAGVLTFTIRKTA
jgi:tRNA 2-thiouridine synthesizing protein A